jgi:thioredoxin-related protein
MKTYLLILSIIFFSACGSQDSSSNAKIKDDTKHIQSSTQIPFNIRSKPPLDDIEYID